MYPSFCKNLGPFSLEQLSSKINILSTNVKNDYSLNEFLGITHPKENTLTFINDNEDIKQESLDLTDIQDENDFQKIIQDQSNINSKSIKHQVLGAVENKPRKK